MDKSENKYYYSCKQNKPKESKKVKQPHWITDEIKSLLHKIRSFKSNQEKCNKEFQKQCN